MRLPRFSRHKFVLTFSVCCSLAANDVPAQSGGGANSGGAANTVEGTGRGAGGPGDGEGPGQGAGQGLGPGGREKETAEKERTEREDKERTERERKEKERADKQREEKDRQEKEKQEKERGEPEREAKERQENEREQERERPQKENDRVDREKDERQREQTERQEREKERTDSEKQPQDKDRKREESEREQREREERDRPDRIREDREREQPERGKEDGDRDDKDRSEEGRGRPQENQEREERAKDREDKERERERAEKKRDEQERPERGEKNYDPPKDRDEKNPEDAPRGSDRTGDDAPSPRDLTGNQIVPDALSRDIIPGADNIPGAPDAQRALRDLTDPVSAREGLFGFLFGGRRPAASPQPAEAALGSGKEIIAPERPARTRRSRGAFLGMFRLEVPDLISAAKVRRLEVGSGVTSPRTLTYKSRLSRVSRWIGPLTLGLLNYVPFETMNAAVSGRMNNLMAEEEISVEEIAARVFREDLASGKRFVIGSPAEAYAELEITRYALDPVPTSIGRMKPTVSLTGRLYSPSGRLLWIGKGFSTIAERGIKGATVEQYEDNPAALCADFENAVRVASRRLAMQANALPRAKVTVVADQR